MEDFAGEKTRRLLIVQIIICKRNPLGGMLNMQKQKTKKVRFLKPGKNQFFKINCTKKIQLLMEKILLERRTFSFHK